MHDPNFPDNLQIRPSTRKSIKLTALRREVAADEVEDNAARQEEPEEDDEDAEQDIETFGIAGRTWEAAYAMRLYLTPPSQSSSLVFDPPCLLFGDASTGSVLPAASSAVTSRPPRNATRRTIIEIGSGTGYLSLALAPHLAAEDSLILTDLHEVCPLLEKNLTTARKRWKTTGRTVEAEVLVRPLPWGDSEALHKLETEGWEADVILASDLVYFPMLYPPLLRTLIGLTGRREGGKTKTKVLFSYKIRSLVREQPFWSSFGRWFSFEAVLAASLPPSSDASLAATTRPLPLEWNRFGTGDEDELFIFVCERRPETYDWQVPESDEELLRGAAGQAGADDQFERLLLGGMDWDCF